MVFLRCICILICWMRRAQFEPILDQYPAEILVVKGGKLELTCAANEPLGRLAWYRIDENSVSHFVISMNVMDKIQRGYGIDERFTSVKTNFRSKFSLVIKKAQPTDNGTYHCMMKQQDKVHLGAGSVVTVVPEKAIVVTSPPTTTTATTLKIIRHKHPLHNKKKWEKNEYVCDWPIWASLAAFNILLIISILFVFIHHKNKYYRRRCPHQFRKG
ncbi:uncharacterized protein LOC134345815 [Mobula hypostoma]|uniref:uncharacterized protein LOC134345815 n=1 Tax=Mobula hypostoma TaxID=723540 RepID=UPI002FC3D4B4